MRTVYEQLGEEAGLRSLVRRFYQFMDELPETREIRQLHPWDLSSSEEKLFLFLSGWTGGPSLYIEKYGHPMLRKRHLPFPIGEAERDQWMICMNRALDEAGLAEPMLSELRQSFHQLADHMRNKATEQGNIFLELPVK